MSRNSLYGFLLIASLILMTCPGCGRNTTEPVFGAGPRRIIVISLDTLRADHLGCYGYARDTSPFLDGLAAESVRFSRVTAPSNFTLPSHLSLFTGLYPTHHKVVNRFHGLSDQIGSLVEILQKSGFATGAFTGHGYMLAKFGHDRGFDTYVSGKSTERSRLSTTLNDAEAWLKNHEEEDAFLFVHTYEIHMPYKPPLKYVEKFLGNDPISFSGSMKSMENLKKRGNITEADVREVVGRYDAGIAYADDLLGDWWQRLEAAGLTENLMLIISSDHGEAFWEHGEHGHGKDLLNDGVTNIPLIVKLPGTTAGVAGHVAEIECSFMDILPTVLESVGLPRPEGLDAFSLLPEMVGGKAEGPDRSARKRRTERLEAGRLALGLCEGAHFYAVRAGDLKALVAIADADTVVADDSALADWPGFYDLQSDPREQIVLPPDRKAFRELSDAVTRLMDGNRPAVEIDDELILDADTRRQLKALGYL